MFSIEALKSLCGPEWRSEMIGSPFSVEREGRWWHGATDGHGLVLQAGDGSLRTENTPPVAALLRQRQATHRVDMAALIAWLTAEPPTEKCSSCGGSGKHECNCFACDIVHGDPCPECEGNGEFPRALPAVLNGVEFDRAIAGRFLRAFTGKADVSFAGETEAISFRGDNWTVLIMPRKHDKNDPAEAVPAGLFEVA